MIKLILAITLISFSPMLFAATGGCSDNESCLPGSSGASDNVDGQACFAVTAPIEGAFDRAPIKVTQGTDANESSGTVKSDK